MNLDSTSRVALLIIAAASSVLAAEPTREQLDFFEQKVRPILADRCYSCHSLQEGKAKGGLTLDTKAGWEKGGDDGSVIKPGDVDGSTLIAAVRYDDADLQMPPKGEKLSDEQIAVLTDWVKMGAPDPRLGPKNINEKLSGLTDKARTHWSYQAVHKPEIPPNANIAWCKTPVDAFILQKLDENGLTPNKPATKEALIRRAYYDLIGLPPTPYEVGDFLKDNSSNAFAKVVDKLLASPAYGERWGRHWLDTARYSDTIGGEKNANRTTSYRYPNAWTYRDYVIKAFNDDKSYDQFIIEQLAADQLPDIKPDDPRLAGLGFLTVGERFRNVNDVINDRIDTVSKGFLGLTVSCARCHDHMFDPIPQKDYYALHGIFASIYEPTEQPTLPTNIKSDQLADYQQKHAAMLTQLKNRYIDTVDSYMAEFFEKPGRHLQASFLYGRRGKGGNAEQLQKRNEILREGKLDEQFVQYLFRGAQKNPSVFGPLARIARTGTFRLADLDRVDDMTPRQPRKKAGKGVVKEEPAPGMMSMMGGNQADHERGPNKYVVAALTANPPKDLEEAIEVYARLFKSVADKQKGLAAALKSASSASVPGYDDDLIDLLRGPFDVAPTALLTQETIESAQATWPNKISARAKLNFGELNLLEISHPGSPAKAMVVADRPNPRNSPVLIRGEAQSRGAIEPRHFLEILSPSHRPEPFTEGSGRLELAKAIASKDNPLVARVAMNRLWMHHFGEGLVPTPDDLGVQSGKPSHPELLDYLAAKFIEFGWSMKQMHRVVMLSSVYQQSSETNPTYEAKDPANKYLWRANIRRLDFEATRDSLLVFTGQLDRTLGGKPVNLTDEPYSYRRSVYGYIDRGNLPELMQHFDFSDPDMPNSKRSTTVVPQQALFLMNSPMAVDVARKLIARPEIAKADNDEKVRWLYRILFQRLPKPEELTMARSFIQQVRSSDDTEPENIVSAAPQRPLRGKGKKMAKPPMPQRNVGKFGPVRNEGEVVDRSPITAWEAYAQALLFSNEVAYVN